MSNVVTLHLFFLSVSLYDSLDDTGGDDKRTDTAGSVDRGNMKHLESTKGASRY